MTEDFVGKKVEFEIGDKEYKLKCPSAKMIPKLLYLQNKYSGRNFSEITEEDIEKFIRVIEDCVRRTYPNWSEESRDDFVVQNFNVLMEKLPLTMGATEEQIKEAKKNVENIESKADRQ